MRKRVVHPFSRDLIAAMAFDFGRALTTARTCSSNAGSIPMRPRPSAAHRRMTAGPKVSG
eukprot:12461230-Alexandrium_andersonii.AAC.1